MISVRFDNNETCKNGVMEKKEILKMLDKDLRREKARIGCNAHRNE